MKSSGYRGGWGYKSIQEELRKRRSGAVMAGDEQGFTRVNFVGVAAGQPESLFVDAWLAAFGLESELDPVRLFVPAPVAGDAVGWREGGASVAARVTL